MSARVTCTYHCGRRTAARRPSTSPGVEGRTYAPGTGRSGITSKNSTVLSGDPIEEVRALKEQPGQDIVVTGSIALSHTLIEADLVDEYRLFVYPVVQGRGQRLFPDGSSAPS